ncbi:butyrate kinase [Marinitoga sp. 1135]|uniref:Probable butyrate kinase n=1 Tax=Marinitoga piezophila (strain DSM 14283 / JCM 11233 / KA3) TaxID=443254 RepID=H2J389_MARPK|nr:MULTISPECIES: butyrate kinase [Marinitoga]AEX84607.1 butyrate kinase [Marinitoga piezophila KA3]APT75126.1 butyrate kinase [Marinitoga sp. 1137]NUU94897.1 butyrate kinase [Marinitoga sp. 1135]NUU96835.1 butyrate kinase [Marinitoga sp. 1138]
MKRILVINPGSTSTKIAVFEDNNLIVSEEVSHSMEELEKYDRLMDQIDLRKNEIEEFIGKYGYKVSDFDAIAARGGILPPLESGTYKVNEEMVDYLRNKTKIEHASNLAAVIGWELSNGEIPIFITDPVSVDEFIPESRISGIPEIERRSLFHALNMKSVARKAAKELNKKYEDCNFVIAHLGGGISVGAQRKGKMIDVNNANDEGPFSPERTGELPVGDLAKMAFSGKYDKKELKKRYIGKGGLVAYLGTNDLREAMKKAETDEYAKKVVEAMAYQIAKEIGGMAAILKGEVDAIIITGGMARNDVFIDMIKQRVSKIALIMRYPGSFEMEALAEGALRVLNNEEPAKEWKL